MKPAVVTPAIAADVAAFNDVAIHWLKTPCSSEELAARMSFAPFAREPGVDWLAIHADYMTRFANYMHDPETLTWREKRRDRMSRGRSERRR